MYFLIIIVSIIYILAIWYLIIGIIRAIPKAKIDSEPNKKISVIIAARNEEKNVLNLLHSLDKQSYPKKLYEVIIVDDRSYDNTYDLVNNYSQQSNMDMRVLQLSEKGRRNGKKYAITEGINNSKYDILLFTDSDCIVNPQWIETFARAYDDKTDYILGYTHVRFQKKTLLNRLKTFESILYRVIASSGLGNKTPMTASASNMSYRKSVFTTANGFGRYKNIKSGDDDLQLFNLWVHLRGKKYLFTPMAQVETIEKESFQSYVNLDTRRASKFKYYPLALKLFSIAVFLYYIVFLLSILYLFKYPSFISLFSLLFGIRIISEFLMMSIFCFKIKKLSYVKYYFIFTLVYAVSFLIFSLRGVLLKYKWKS